MKLEFILAVSAITIGIPISQNLKVNAASAKIDFSVKGPFGTVHGSFSGLKATIRFNIKDLSGSAITASLEAKTVSTGIGLRNNDLRNKGEFLNTDKYPQISFQSKKIEKTAQGYKALGDLTIKDVTRPVEIPFTFTTKGAISQFKGQFQINREDYHVGNKGGMVGSIITINLEVPVNN